MDKAEDRHNGPLYRYRFGACQFDESQFELCVGGLTVEVEQKPLHVLAALLRRPGELVSRGELLETIWNGRVTVEQVLTNAVAKLRKALGECDGARIVTVPRSGYRFTGHVERIAVGARPLNRLDLKAGENVPGREHFVLQVRLAASSRAQIWLARHSKTDAVRVYKFAQDTEHLRALKREATLCRLLHEALGERDDLARLLDWQFESFPFYIEYEYGGPDLVLWADESARLATLSRSERIGLFLQIADAVAAAHAIGLLHKDLKPTNVLISDRAGGGVQARVTDFGSGGLLSPERLEELGITQLGMTMTQDVAQDFHLGTPLYLAPELILGGSPTVQSDLFALGLMLYQIVSGDLRKPMASGWEQDIGDDLLAECITAATYGDPARRLNSVAELSQRLRTLEARRVERESERRARDRAALAERALERARIRRPWIATALVTLLMGIGVSYNAYRKERLTRVEAQRAATRAQTIDRFLSEDLLGAADASGSGPTHDPSVREALARTAATLDARFATDPQTKASIELALGTAYFGLTDYGTAEKYRRDALRLLTVSQGAQSSAALEATYDLATVMMNTQRLDEAARMLETADHLAGARLDELSWLALKAHWTRAQYYKLRLSAARALPEYAAADRTRAVIDPNNDKALLRLRDGLSWCYVRMGRAADAEAVLHEVISPRYTPERVSPLLWSSVRIDDAIALMSLQRLSEAEQLLTEALHELQSAVGSDSNFVGVAQIELGEVYMRRSQWADATGSLREAYRIFALNTGQQGPNTLIAGANLGIVEYKTGHSIDAVNTLAPIRTTFVDKLGEASPLAQVVAFYLACAERDLRRYTEASALVRHLDPARLAEAEPRDDWDVRLEALRQLPRAHTVQSLN